MSLVEHLPRSWLAAEDDLEVMIGDRPIAVPALDYVGLLHGRHGIRRCCRRRSILCVEAFRDVQHPADLDDAGGDESLAVVHHVTKIAIQDVLSNVASATPIAVGEATGDPVDAVTPRHRVSGPSQGSCRRRGRLPLRTMQGCGCDRNGRHSTTRQWSSER